MSDVRVPPNSQEGERAILGAILLNNAALDEVAHMLKPGSFYRTGHQSLYAAFLSMQKRGLPIDIVTVVDYLREQALSEQCGGPAYIAELTNEVPTTAHAKHYAGIVRDAAFKRKVIYAASALRESAYTADDIADHLTAFDMAVEAPSAAVVESNNDLLTKAYKRYEDLHSGAVEPGMRHGLYELEQYVLIKGQKLYIVAGRPGSGKSALALSIAEGMAGNGYKINFHSLEMSADELTDRRIAMLGRVELDKLNTGKLRESDWPKLSGGFGRAKGRGEALRIIETPAVNVQYVRACAANRMRKDGLDAIFVDYLQLMTGPGGSREAEVSAISRGLKAIAMELKIPVIAMSQLNRKCEERMPPTPKIYDLRESGSIEQDADVVMMVYRQDLYEETMLEAGKEKFIDPFLKGRGRVFIPKQRQGKAGGFIDLDFNGEFTSYDNPERR